MKNFLKRGVRAYEANGALVTDLRERREHLRRDSQTGWRQCAIDVEEADCFLDRAVLEIGVHLGHIEEMYEQVKSEVTEKAESSREINVHFLLLCRAVIF